MPVIQRIVPCLWFDGQAEDAANAYVSIFPASRITLVSRYMGERREVECRKLGSVLSVTFELDGVQLTALNGGPRFRFSEALSLQVMCDSQREIDHYWEKLGAGGDATSSDCGWLKDRYGLSWQIVPSGLDRMVADPDSAKAGRVARAIMGMKKPDMTALRMAYEG